MPVAHLPTTCRGLLCPAALAPLLRHAHAPPLPAQPYRRPQDFQESWELMFDTVDTTYDCVRISTGVLSTLRINPDRMLAGLSADMLATDLAEYLVRKGGCAVLCLGMPRWERCAVLCLGGLFLGGRAALHCLAVSGVGQFNCSAPPHPPTHPAPRLPPAPQACPSGRPTTSAAPPSSWPRTAAASCRP